MTVSAAYIVNKQESVSPETVVNRDWDTDVNRDWMTHRDRRPQRLDDPQRPSSTETVTQTSTDAARHTQRPSSTETDTETVFK